MPYENPPLKRIVRSLQVSPIYITDLNIRLDTIGDEVDLLQIQPWNGKYFRTLNQVGNSADLDFLIRAGAVEVEDQDGNVINGITVDANLDSTYLATLWDIINAGAGTITIQGNSIGLGDFSTINFTGAGVTVADAGGGVATVTITGGGGSGTALSKEITQTSHGLSLGEAVYFDGTDWLQAQADASSTLGIGLVSDVADADTFTVTFTGIVTGLSGLTAGEYYFVSTTVAGGLTTTKPSTGYENPILFATDTTEGIVFAYRPSAIAATGGGGAASFTDLDDVPSTYTGSGGYLVKVKDDETGLEFVGDGSVYAQQIDFISDDLFYTGIAAPGSSTASAVWRIKKTTIDNAGEGDVTVTWADGDTNFDNIWDNRLALSYS